MTWLATWPRRAFGQLRAETVRPLTDNNVSTLDITLLGASRESFGLSMSTYGGLLAFGRKPSNGNQVFDANAIHLRPDVIPLFDPHAHTLEPTAG